MPSTPRDRDARRNATAVVAGAVAGIVLLLFMWPIARVPEPGVVPGFLQILAAWALSVAALWWLSRRVGPDDDEAPSDGGGR